MVTRRGFDAQLRWMQAEYPLDANGSSSPVDTSAMFDLSVVEMFWPLMVGAAVILPRQGGGLEPTYLGELADQHAATVVNFVPSLLRIVLDACAGSPWRTIRIVFCGGEALSLDLARNVRTVFPNAELHNQYGPTETTINATYWHCKPDETTVPIGLPVADTTLYVLDADLAPVSPGGLGELWIGGVQLARGYLRRPALTAVRFIPNPFAARPGERIYKTGDLVRQRTDGALEYVGRSDFQVKVRGFRIEPGEIEAVLCTHPNVRSAVVVARDDRSNSKVLAAYICTADSTAIDDLSSFVAERLPEYMVPATFTVLDELPRTPAGKIDRNALPVPQDDARSADYVAPRTPMESALAAIWCKLLGIERVSIHDDFFQIGGHSLLALELLTKIRQELDVDMALSDVFAAPTVAQMAALDIFAAPVVQPHTSVEPLSLTDGPTAVLQPYMYWCHMSDPKTSLVLDAWQVRGPLDPAAFERAVTAVVVRHQILRTNYALDGKVLRQIIRPSQPPYLPSHEYEDVSGHPEGDKRGRAITQAITKDALATREIDLHDGPSIRIKLIRLAPDEHLLLRLLPHIVFDGPSNVLFNDELAVAYRTAVEDPSADVAIVADTLPFQFVDVAAYLSSYRDAPRRQGGDRLLGEGIRWRPTTGAAGRLLAR